jgi:hypothetical protein
MKKEDFINTKWDAREWTKEQKAKWQNRIFELGFSWGGWDKRVRYITSDFYYVSDSSVTYGGDFAFFNGREGKLMTYEDAFPSPTQHLEGQRAKARFDSAIEPLPSKRSSPRNKYDREILPGIYVDVYDVLGAFTTGSPSVDHAVKKLLAPGQRGVKSRTTDLKEAISSIEREIDRINEWGDNLEDK